MNRPEIAPPDYRVPFRVEGNSSLIRDYSAKGIIVEVDKSKKYACACFDNTNDFNDFKKVVESRAS